MHILLIVVDFPAWACGRQRLITDRTYCTGRLTAFTLSKQEKFNRPLVSPEGDLVLPDLLVDAVADGLGACLLLLSESLFVGGFVFSGEETVDEWVWGGYDGHGKGWWYLGERRDATLFCQPAEPDISHK